MHPPTESYPSSTTHANVPEPTTPGTAPPPPPPPSDPNSSSTTTTITPSNLTPTLGLSSLRPPDPETAVPLANDTTATAPPRSRWHWTTRAQRRDILVLRRRGHSYEQIARRLGLTVRKVQYTCQSQRDTPRKPSGRRSRLGDAQLDAVVAFLAACPENRRLPYRKVIEALALGVSEECLARALARRGYHRREAVSGRRRLMAPTAAAAAAATTGAGSDLDRRDEPEVWGEQRAV
ncbi:hypothetical protein VTN02DRAFT_4604 [Thermoascus thermophilus]